MAGCLRPERSGVAYADSPEAAFLSRLDRAAVTELSARAPLPAGLTAEPALLARYVAWLRNLKANLRSA